jgi:hypothetical protein
MLASNSKQRFPIIYIMRFIYPGEASVGGVENGADRGSADAALLLSMVTRAGEFRP